MRHPGHHDRSQRANPHLVMAAGVLGAVVAFAAAAKYLVPAVSPAPRFYTEEPRMPEALPAPPADLSALGRSTAGCGPERVPVYVQMYCISDHVLGLKVHNLSLHFKNDFPEQREEICHAAACRGLDDPRLPAETRRNFDAWRAFATAPRP